MQMRKTELLILQSIQISAGLALSSQVGSTAFEAGRLSTYSTPLLPQTRKQRSQTPTPSSCHCYRSTAGTLQKLKAESDCNTRILLGAPEDFQSYERFAFLSHQKPIAYRHWLHTRRVVVCSQQKRIQTRPQLPERPAMWLSEDMETNLMAELLKTQQRNGTGRNESLSFSVLY